MVFSLEGAADELQDLYRLLSEDEIRRAARYRFDRHRNRFIAGRGRIRQILAAEGNCSPRDIVFELNPYGKPAIEKPEPLSNVCFNASSSDTLGAIAIANGIALGLDIEKIKPANHRDYDMIAKNEFSSDEHAWYERHGYPERLRVFFELWTCKEAYLKALGIGLSGKLDSFSINLDENEPRIDRTDLEPGSSTSFSLRRLDIHAEFAACLALPATAVSIDLSRR